MALLKRLLGLAAATTVATVMFTAAPAAASEWVYHSSYEGDIFFDDQCGDAGDALVASGAALTWYCQVNNSTGLWDLYVVTGTWIYGGAYGDAFDCGDAGDALIAAGTAITWKCEPDPSHPGYTALYYV